MSETSTYFKAPESKTSAYPHIIRIYLKVETGNELTPLSAIRERDRFCKENNIPNVQVRSGVDAYLFAFKTKADAMRLKLAFA